MQTLRKAAVARASTTLNIIQQVGASMGTAVMTIILVNALPGAGAGLGAAADVPAAARARIAPLMADAFGHTFWWAFGFLLVAFGAAWLLPRSRPETFAAEEAEEDVPATPVLMHA